MNTTPKPLYTPESVDEALLVLDNVAQTPDLSDWTLYQAIDMAAQKLRPVPTPDHDAEALEQLARKYPIDLPWMQPEGLGYQVGDKFYSASNPSAICTITAITSHMVDWDNPSGSEACCNRSEFEKYLGTGHWLLCPTPIIAASILSNGGRANCLNSDCAGCEKGGEGK
ncbi:hypothetical protein K3G63_11030 [Hymenobacter sp. HSC-4F20]|uniref:hypothetical protein n=1 Tax=Hymenobacter sp. HSC-4F20 TaxID=2864135 RepID=UPI001C7395B5|nr:hypothetical protein [Hymenobacter sp. HSC-4F20]MBX0290976.1 hypothetical protein [Hymenobacter sp. HSC-4F20]